MVYDELKPFLERIDSHQHRIKKLLRKVTAAHSQIKVMTAYMSEGIIFLNKKGEIILINQSAQSIFNIEDPENIKVRACLISTALQSFVQSLRKEKRLRM